MLVRRPKTGLYIMAIFYAGSTAWAFPWFGHSKPKSHTAAPAKAVKIKPADGTDQLHIQAQFYYDGRVIAPVSGTEALLYDATDPETRDVVEAINHGGDGVAQASSLCAAHMVGREQTISPSGDIFFDYVDRGNYWIVVCKQVKFEGVAKPVWVAGAAPVASVDFTDQHVWEFELAPPLQINLDHYAAELKAKPVDTAYVAPEPMPRAIVVPQLPDLPMEPAPRPVSNILVAPTPKP